jgi:hypothetical protein
MIGDERRLTKQQLLLWLYVSTCIIALEKTLLAVEV